MAAPAPAPAAAKPAGSPAGVAQGQVIAANAASARAVPGKAALPGAAPAEEDTTPKAPPLDPVKLSIWLRQTVLLLTMLAFGISLAIALSTGHVWLRAVLYAGIAGVLTGVIGMQLAQVGISLAVSTAAAEKAAKKASEAKS